MLEQKLTKLIGMFVLCVDDLAGWLVFLLAVLWAAALMFTAVFFVRTSLTSAPILTDRTTSILLLCCGSHIGHHVLGLRDRLHKPDRLLQ